MSMYYIHTYITMYVYSHTDLHTPTYIFAVESARTTRGTKLVEHRSGV